MGKTTHGMCKHPMYQYYQNMMSRCYNDSYNHHYLYKEKSIEVCDEWKNDIHQFISWAEKTYVKGMSLDRIDTNSGYCPKNCRWTDKTTQSRNTVVLQRNNKSGYRGVCFDNTHKHWIAYIKINKKQVRIGRFKTAELASEAYINYVIDNNLDHKYK